METKDDQEEDKELDFKVTANEIVIKAEDGLINLRPENVKN